MENLNGKIIVVAGGAGLIGKNCVQTIIDAGGIAISADTAHTAPFKKNSSSLITAHMNIVSKKSINVLFTKLIKQYRKIDALINCAYPRDKNFGRKFEDVEYGDFCENVALHLGGYFLISQQILAFFKKQKYGNLVNFSSVYGFLAPRFNIYEGTNMTVPVEYAAIKAGIIQLTKYMASYCKGDNIRVNCISPGGIYEKQNQIFVNRYKSFCLNKGLLDACDLKGTLLYLLSDMSLYVNGQNLIIDDGFSL